MIHRSFLKSAQLFKLNEKRLFDKMEHRLEEEQLRAKMSIYQENIEEEDDELEELTQHIGVDDPPKLDNFDLDVPTDS